jgi:hypothetical protein
MRSRAGRTPHPPAKLGFGVGPGRKKRFCYSRPPCGTPSPRSGGPCPLAFCPAAPTPRKGDLLTVTPSDPWRTARTPMHLTPHPELLCPCPAARGGTSRKPAAASPAAVDGHPTFIGRSPRWDATVRPISLDGAVSVIDLSCLAQRQGGSGRYFRRLRTYGLPGSREGSWADWWNVCVSQIARRLRPLLVQRSCLGTVLRTIAGAGGVPATDATPDGCQDRPACR